MKLRIGNISSTKKTVGFPCPDSKRQIIRKTILLIVSEQG